VRAEQVPCRLYVEQLALKSVGYTMKLATFPRAAVSVAVRFCYEDVPLYVMVQVSLF
jgi:hypothetical protein